MMMMISLLFLCSLRELILRAAARATTSSRTSGVLAFLWQVPAFNCQWNNGHCLKLDIAHPAHSVKMLTVCKPLVRAAHLFHFFTP